MSERNWRESLRRSLRRCPPLYGAARGVYRGFRKARRRLRLRSAGGAAQQPERPPIVEISDAGIPVLAVVARGWYGVTTSTRSNFPNLMLWDGESPSIIARSLLESDYSTIVFSGMPVAVARAARIIKKRDPERVLLVHYHGSFTQCAQPIILDRFQRVLGLARDGVVDRIGCAKASLARTLQRLGLSAMYVPNRTSVPGTVRSRPAGSPRRIGVFVRDILRKNAHTQLVAALMMENVEVHANDAPDLSYLPGGHRIVEHGELPNEEFTELLGQMDLNLYVSLSECYPMVVVESMIRAVPCLTSRSHEILAYDEELAEKLICPAPDNPLAIAEQAERILADREAIGRRCRQYALELNSRAEAGINQFVGFELWKRAQTPQR